MPRASSASQRLFGNGSRGYERLHEARERNAHLVRLLENDPQKRRRPHVAVGSQLGHRLHLLLGLPGAGRKHGAAERVRARFQHRSRRREVVRKTVVDEIAAAKPGREQRSREAPIIGPAALRLVDRTGRGEHAQRIAQRVAARPPKGRADFCNSSNADLRVTGSCANAARVVIAATSTSARMRANAGAWAFAYAACRGNRASCARSRSSGSRISSSSKWSAMVRASGCARRIDREDRVADARDL